MTTPTTEHSNIIDVWVSVQPQDLQAGDYVRYGQAHFDNEEREGEVVARAGYLSDGTWVLRFNSRPDRFSAAVTPGSMEVRRKGFMYDGVTYVEGDEVSLNWHSCYADCDSYADCLGGTVESVTGTLLYRDGVDPDFSVEHPDGFVICTSSSSPDEVGGVSNLHKVTPADAPTPRVLTTLEEIRSAQPDQIWTDRYASPRRPDLRYEWRRTADGVWQWRYGPGRRGGWIGAHTDQNQLGRQPLTLIGEAPTEIFLAEAAPAEPTDVETLRRQHEEWKANLARDAIRLAQDHGYCTVVENFLREHGVTPTARGYRATATVEVEIDFDLEDGRFAQPDEITVHRILQNAQFQLSPVAGTTNAAILLGDSRIRNISPRS